MRGLVLSSDTHSAQLLETFSDLLRNNVLTDVTLVCEDRYRVEAHKIVLCAGSSMFRDFFTHNSHPHPMLYLKGVKQIHLLPLMQFLYNGKTEIPEDFINELLDVAKDLSIKGLEEEKKCQPNETQYRKSLKETKLSKHKTKKRKSEDIMKRHQETELKNPDEEIQPAISYTVEEENHNCGICNFVGGSKESLDRHISILHPLSEEKDTSASEEEDNFEDDNDYFSFAEKHVKDDPIKLAQHDDVKFFEAGEVLKRVPKSTVWKFMKFKGSKSEGLSDKNHVYCELCRKSGNSELVDKPIVFKDGSTKNLINHLNSCHAYDNEYIEAQPSWSVLGHPQRPSLVYSLGGTKLKV